MPIKLQELRRFAIEERAEIKVIDSSTGNQCELNDRGQAKIADNDRDKEFRIEQIIDAADTFEIRSQGKTGRLTAAEMEQAVANLFKSRGAPVVVREED